MASAVPLRSGERRTRRVGGHPRPADGSAVGVTVGYGRAARQTRLIPIMFFPMMDGMLPFVPSTRYAEFVGAARRFVSSVLLPHQI